MRNLKYKRGFGHIPTTSLCTYLIIIILLALVITIFHHTITIKNVLESTTNPSVGSQKHDTKPNNTAIPVRSCETIHLAIVCGRFNSTRDFYVLLKSILFYRTQIIQLHLFVDNISNTILRELFSTWVVPDLTVQFYNITTYESEVSWIPSDHYSHRYGLMKLVFLSVLSYVETLEKVILLDTDMLAFGDINRLWARAQDPNVVMNSKLIFGIVENQSDWYSGKTQLSRNLHSAWPAIGSGFNSGLLLVNLDRLRLIKWSETWRQVAELELTTHLTTSLADQDIFNAVFASFSYMVYKLPCSYNVQLNDHTNLSESCILTQDFMLAHWNSPYKLSTKNPKATFFRNWYLSFLNWDGGLLQQSFCSFVFDTANLSSTTNNHVSDSESSVEHYCKDIQPRPDQKLRTFLYYNEFELEPVDHDVTFVVHLSLDRLQTLDQLALHWQGPISAAIYLPETETNLLISSIIDSNNLLGRKNIGYHLVYRGEGFSYPINRLRNVALNNALTPYVFLSDIDFLPSLNLYQYLRQILGDMVTKGTKSPLSKCALVVPAFENLQYKFDFPSSKAELLSQLNLGTLSMFREQLWPQGHSPTDYAKWRASTKPYKIEWELEYEPFIVVSKDVLRFDERFVGFGWNKVEHIMELAAQSYEFIVLPEAFVIHKFHSASFDIMKHRESIKYRSCIKKLRRQFLIELKRKYPKFLPNVTGSSQFKNNVN